MTLKLAFLKVKHLLGTDWLSVHYGIQSRELNYEIFQDFSVGSIHHK